MNGSIGVLSPSDTPLAAAIVQELKNRGSSVNLCLPEQVAPTTRFDNVFLCAVGAD
eukprot:SAG31_NODE_11118_length_1064_cov_1.209326_1_plen_55_part_10